MKKREQVEFRTGVVHNTKRLYWLNISNVVHPPTKGFRMTRKGLKELRLQIDRVLAGYHGGGYAYTCKGLERIRFTRTKPEI